MPDLPYTHVAGVPADTRVGIRRLALRRASGLVLACVLGVNLLAQTAHADDLTDKRNRVNAEIAQTKREMTESSARMQTAAAALEKSQDALATAQALLSKTREDLAAAVAKDTAMKVKLAKERKKLAAAKVAVADGQKKVDAQQALIGEEVRQQYQQQTNLTAVSIMLAGQSQADVQTRMQWSTTIFDTSQAKMVRLNELQAKLEAAKAEQARIEKQVAADRQAAAENLTSKQNLEAAAATQAANVADLVDKNSDNAAAAAREVASDKKQYSDLTAERASVDRRIADRIAKAKAAARAKAAAERRAREAAARARSAKAAARSAKSSASSSRIAKAVRKSGSSAATRIRRSSGNGGFIYPVSAPITSKYGMRFHPVLHYWKLHDGTDFGAGCGTPMRAAASGTVTEKYFNGGYGNRLMIDHGLVNGRYVTTGYNHAIRYTVGVGQRVSKGQVIGYVGTTGYSTGCHLHLMVWVNGSMVNPMTVF